jgi:hypothetical protein
MLYYTHPRPVQLLFPDLADSSKRRTTALTVADVAAFLNVTESQAAWNRGPSANSRQRQYAADPRSQVHNTPGASRFDCGTMQILPWLSLIFRNDEHDTPGDDCVDKLA